MPPTVYSGRLSPPRCSRPQLESVDDGGCVVFLLDVAGDRVVVLLVVVLLVIVALVSCC